MKKGVITDHNVQLINEFQKLVDQIKIQIDISPSTDSYVTNNFRLKQIKKGLEIIKKFPTEIKAGSDLEGIPGIGKGIMNRVDEIINKGRLSEIKISKTEKKHSEYVDELIKIHGIGHTKAYELITQYGIKNIKDLMKAYNDGVIDLNNVILTGLKYYNIVQEKIPRSEIDKIYDYLDIKAKNIDKDLLVTVCGSYRRLKPTSNDVDILLTHPNVKTKLQIVSQNNYLLQFVKELKDDKFILDDLTDKDYKIKYMGYCQLKSHPVRRIDIRYIPYESFYSALLYFTGNAEFNKKMRGIAEQLGYMLNEYGLYKLEKNKKRKIKISSEKDIFDKLGMEYLPPEKRE